MWKRCAAREGLQWKAHSEARARTCNGKPDPGNGLSYGEGDAQIITIRS